jgi:hypothetical protein
MTDSKRQPKYLITLRSLNTQLIDDKYNLSTETKATTKISDLDTPETRKTMVFMGPSKQLHKCNVSMIDHQTGNALNNTYNCFWCRNAFDNLPIGCPLKHTPDNLEHVYDSIINSQTYKINETVNSNQYITDGAFCSFNCCMSHIEDNKKNVLYRYSKQLLLKMYNDMFNTKTTSISTAPHWRILKEYGGNTSIEDFRSSFDRVEYKYHGKIKMTNECRLFEKKLKF